MMRNPLVTVVVSVYNVERYLRQCIDSIVNQTYNNLDIILIDDGSTDLSGKICDEYQEQDKRIRVVHKQNAGLSASRNTGLEMAKGEWIAFVDSDDWVRLDMYERLLSLAEEYSAEVVMCRFTSDENEMCVNGATKPTGGICAFDRESLLEAYYYPPNNCRISTSVWDRIYKKELLDGISFPTGRVIDDIYFTVEVFCRCKRAIYTDDIMYFYRPMRTGSITATKFSRKKVEDNIYLYCEAEKKLREIGRVDLAEKCFCKLYTVICTAYTSKIDAETIKYIRDYRKTVKDKVKALIHSKHLLRYDKIVLALNFFTPRLKTFLEKQMNKRGLMKKSR